MARKGTIAFAEKTLTPEQFAAWQAMPVKLSKRQLEAGERPPPKEEEPESDFLHAIFDAAEAHGKGSTSEMEVGDLQAALEAFWECMGEKSRKRAQEDAGIVEFLKEWGVKEENDEADPEAEA